MKKANGSFILFTIFGLIILFATYSSLVQRSNEETTVGEFVEGESYTTTSSDGDISAAYKWKYRYTVDGHEYYCYAYGRSQSAPYKTTAKVYYNPANPERGSTNVDDGTLIAFLIGGLCMLPLFSHISKSFRAVEDVSVTDEEGIQAKYSKDEETGRREYKRFAMFWFVFSLVAFIICIHQQNIGACIFVGIFVIIGIHLLKKANNPDNVFVSYKEGQRTTLYSFSNEQFAQSGYSTKKLLDNQFRKEEEQSNVDSISSKKIGKTILLLFGIIFIMSGVLCTLLSSAALSIPQMIPEAEDMPYYINGVQVTKEEFYADTSLTAMTIVFIIVGIIQFVTGLLMVVLSRKK